MWPPYWDPSSTLLGPLLHLHPQSPTLVHSPMAAFRQFRASLELHMVEVSPALRGLQWKALGCTLRPGGTSATAAGGGGAPSLSTAVGEGGRGGGGVEPVSSSDSSSGRSALGDCEVGMCGA